MLKAEIKWRGQRLKNIYHWLMATLTVLRYGYPAGKLKVIGVTGTDGKTTTSTLIYEILKEAGYKTGLVSTVEVIIGDEIADTGLHTTNPDPRQLQPLIRKMVEKGLTHLVLEVTAHGLDQYRLLGCNFYIGVLTNVTHEHLDDFVNMERYRRSKLRLFEGVKYAVINGDDKNSEYYVTRISEYRNNTGVPVKIFKYKKTQLINVSPALMGDYNKYNIGAAEAVAKILGIKGDVVARVVRNFAGVPGRRDEIKAGQNFRVIVDFAHTPNALEQVLTQLRKELPGNKKLVAVFGCTGGRDKTKRPMMGEIAARLADIVIITSDDTRNENQDVIAKEIMAGIRNKEGVVIENDRRKAIEKAILAAESGDIILLAGKGHEKSILLGKTEYPWSDAEEAEKAIVKLSK
jgi:UDP-N-acetylmuramoyl-L-alanyl-D-glutamate--2,6-diaminopimelate ligase